MGDRKAVKDSIEAVLTKIDELEQSVSDFDGDNESLHKKLNEYITHLKDLHTVSNQLRHTTGQPFEVPVELLKYLDDGGNPDIFIEDVFRSCTVANDATRAKVEAIKDLKVAYEAAVAESMPQVLDKYRAMREIPPPS